MKKVGGILYEDNSSELLALLVSHRYSTLGWYQTIKTQAVISREEITIKQEQKRRNNENVRIRILQKKKIPSLFKQLIKSAQFLLA